MKIKESVKKVVGSVMSRLMEFSNIPEMGQIDKDDYLYRPLTDTQKARDLLPLTQRRMQDIVMHLYEATPMGKRLIEMHKDFVIGEGIKYEAEDKDVKTVLDEFWYDPINNWEMSQYMKATELSLFGEQFYPVWVNNYTGAVKLGYIDPTFVKEVTRNPMNPMQLMAVRTNQSLKPVTGSKDHPGAQKDLFRIIDFDRDMNSKTYGRLVGEIFFFSVNRVSNGTRGRSDLLPLADWIDVHERFLFNIAERAKLLSVFIWDVTFKGWSDKRIREWVKKHGLKVPKPGSIRYHNENIEWKAETPKLESSDMSTHARLIKNHIASGYGIPPHWIGEGEKTTRATAMEMGGPSYKHFKSRQFYFKYILKFIFNFVIDQAIIHGTLKDTKEKPLNRKFTIHMQPLAERDFSQIATAMTQIATSLQVALDNDWVTDKQAREFFAHVAGQTGFELDVSGERTDKDYSKEKQDELKKKMEDEDGKPGSEAPEDDTGD